MAEDYLRFKDLDLDQLSPMMRQYVEEKFKRPDALLLWRLGDFFEAFFDDAVLVSQTLGLTLTHRDCGLSQQAPMCGVPHHAAESYVARLVERGFKVAICEQMEDPALAQGLVKREVIRVVTPGTVTDPAQLADDQYRYLLAVYQVDAYFGLAYADVSASRFGYTELLYGDTEDKLRAELDRIKPNEVLCNDVFFSGKICKDFTITSQVSTSLQDEKAFDIASQEHYHLLEGREGSLGTAALAALLAYLESSAYILPQPLPAPEHYQVDRYMRLDPTARRHLELVETYRDRRRQGSLLWAIDRTQTAMGARLLREWILQPLLSIAGIRQRQDCIVALLKDFRARQELRSVLRQLYDLERLAGRLALGSALPRDLDAIAGILERIPAVQESLQRFVSPQLDALAASLAPLPELAAELQQMLADELPAKLRDGGIIRDGANAELDNLRALSRHSSQALLEYEQEERERSGIRSLKITYNRVFGYMIEIRKQAGQQLPDDYQRKQTLVNAERYLTPRLKGLEERILGAEEKARQVELQLFSELREHCVAHLPELRQNAALLARIDVYASQAEQAESAGYVRPELVPEAILEIADGRHPVVEKMLEAGSFVPNSCQLDSEDHRLMVLTGPNMAGKSTYMRQNALIVIMAQSGLFVPASSARIGICDQIFTRVGASDDLASGESTFMVEMNEVATILRQASRQSLLILDEIGRGTSTWDGLSIAWAVIEHILKKDELGCRTLFATHYHELTELEGQAEGLFNCHVEISEKDDQLEFLHRIAAGGSDHSYGIEVARLAAVPEEVIVRAQEILQMLEEENQGTRLKLRKASQTPMPGQVDLFSAALSLKKNDALLDRLKGLDINTLRPIDALAELAELQAMAQKM